MTALDAILPGLLVLAAIANLIVGQIEAEAAGRPVLAQARKDLFNDDTPRADHLLQAIPNLRKWEHHHRYPLYAEIYRREHRKAWRHMAKAWVLSGLLIAVSTL
jgi:hypothetical protein